MTEETRLIDNLPPSPAVLVGRQREIVQIERALADPDINVVTIYGVGGTGKTVLARFVVERQREDNHFPGGIVWIDCRIEDSQSKILAVIARATRVEPSLNLSELRESVLSHLHSAPTLLVFDAYEMVADNDEVLSFVGRLPKPTKALIVSRQRVRVPGREISLRLESLTEVETLELLRQSLGPEQWDEADKDALRGIHRWTGGLPLAVVLVASLLKQGWSLPAILAQLREGAISTERVVERIIDQLDPTLSEKQRQFLEALSVFAHPVDGAAVAAVAEMENWRLSGEALARKAAIEITDGRYALHPFVRTYFRDRIAPGQLKVLQQRMVQYYLAFFEKSQDDFDHLDREWLNIQYAVETAYHNQLSQLFIAFVLHLGNFLTAHGYENEYRKWIGQALEDSDKLGDSGIRAVLLHNLAVQYQQRGDLEGAVELYKQSLALKEAAGDLAAESATLTNIGSVYRSRGDIRSAIGYYERALAISQQIGDLSGETNILGSLGVSYADLGDFRRAIAYYEQALAIGREIGDRQGEANVLGNLGAAYAALGDFRRAIAYYEEALAIGREIRDRQGEASLYTNLGVTYSNLYSVTGDSSNIHRALNFYYQALKTFKPETYPLEYATLQNNIANIYATLQTGDKAENIEQAIAHYQEALRIRTSESYPLDWAATQNNLAIAFSQRFRGDRAENLRRAIASYEQALRIYTRENSPYDWLRVTTNLSTAYAELGEWPEAKAQATAILQSFQSTMLDFDSLKALLPWYQRLGELAIQNQDTEFATRIFAEAIHRFEVQGKKAPDVINNKLVELREQLGDDRFVLIWAEAQGIFTPIFAQHLHEARQLMSQEQFGEAVKRLSEAISLLGEMELAKECKQQKAIVLFLRGFCLRKQGLWEEALQDQEQSFQIFDELRDYVGEAHTSLEMGHLFEVMNNYEDARLCYMDAYRLYRRAEDKRGMASASENLGRLEYRVRMLSQAVQDLEEARKLYISVGDRTKAATIDSDLEAARASLAYQATSNNKQDENK